MLFNLYTITRLNIFGYVDKKMPSPSSPSSRTPVLRPRMYRAIDKGVPISYIPIQMLVFDAGMQHALAHFCKKTPKMESKIAALMTSGHGFPLGRWTSVWAGIAEKRAAFEPVTLLLRDDGYYTVVDGRHRATASFCVGYTHVPAIIQQRPSPPKPQSRPRQRIEFNLPPLPNASAH